MPTRDDFFEPDWRAHGPNTGPEPWTNDEAVLYDNATGGEGWDDQFAQSLFYLAYMDHNSSPMDREQYRDMLDEWTHDEYGWDFSDVFDWEAWHAYFYGESGN